MSREEKIVKNRSEILFLYDIQFGNPNGDPADENKPRIDEETGKNLVTDVRLKRTIRDYLHNFKGQEIFVREIADENGYIQTSKDRAKDFLKGLNVSGKSFNEMRELAANKILEQCIDVRLFGATIPIEFKTKGGSKSTTGSITFTGPVQFKIGQSLHRVELMHIKGTGAFASKEKATQKTFREEYILPYSLIEFYGIINENAAKTTKLTNDDVALLLEAIWNGTKNLISRSKMVQTPRFLLRVEFKENNYHIGDLDKKIELHSDLEDEQIRHITEVTIDITKLVDLLKENKDKINKIEYIVDPEVTFQYNGKEKGINEILSEVGVPVSQLQF